MKKECDMTRLNQEIMQTVEFQKMASCPRNAHVEEFIAQIDDCDREMLLQILTQQSSICVVSFQENIKKIANRSNIKYYLNQISLCQQEIRSAHLGKILSGRMLIYDKKYFIKSFYNFTWLLYSWTTAIVIQNSCCFQKTLMYFSLRYFL